MHKRLFIPVLVVALSVGFAPPARAAQPTEGTGTYTNYGFSLTPIGKADGSTLYGLSFSSTLTGILAGSCSATGTEVVHPDGSAIARGSVTCTGTVAGQPGTFLLGAVASAAPDGTVRASFVLSGTGTLANLHGHATAEGTLLSGTNAAVVHFGP
jgi:hypothetical protein